MDVHSCNWMSVIDSALKHWSVARRSPSHILMAALHTGSSGTAVIQNNHNCPTNGYEGGHFYKITVNLHRCFCADLIHGLNTKCSLIELMYDDHHPSVSSSPISICDIFASCPGSHGCFTKHLGICGCLPHPRLPCLCLAKVLIVCTDQGGWYGEECSLVL